MTKDEKRVIECLRELNKQMKLNVDVVNTALSIMGKSIDFIIMDKEKDLEIISDKKFERRCQCGSYARLHRYLNEGNRMECINCYCKGAFSDTDEGAVEEWENGNFEFDSRRS